MPEAAGMLAQSFLALPLASTTFSWLCQGPNWLWFGLHSPSPAHLVSCWGALFPTLEVGTPACPPPDVQPLWARFLF